MGRRKKEGMHYKSKKNNDREYYSIRSLVFDVTGISKEDKGFDAAYKEIQRVVEAFQQLEGIDKGRLRIHRDLKDGFVKATKAFYEKNEFKDILAKFRKEEDLTIDEHDMLIEHFLEATIDGMSAGNADKLREMVEEMRGDEYYDKRDIIENLIIRDMKMADQVKHYPTKINYMDQYIEIINQALVEWRQKVKYNILLRVIFNGVLFGNESDGDEVSSQPSLSFPFYFRHLYWH